MPRAARQLLQDLPIPLRHAVVGAVVLGLGLVTGALVHAFHRVHQH